MKNVPNEPVWNGQVSGELSWRSFLTEGRAFHKTLQGSLKRPEVFNPLIVQNIAAMAIEKYFMAIFMHRGLMPMNHTMTDFLTEAKLFLTLPPQLEETLLYMDVLQQICSLDHFQITPPTDRDIPRFLEAADLVAELAHMELKHATNNDF
ncbi:MAG: hypothetical protein LBQ54_08930 [Planctomycetaceae bacterium]|jgi:hypothetical protein|nr:hypothetical protein [Planctomycetaceae bacterium]